MDLLTILGSTSSKLRDLLFMTAAVGLTIELLEEDKTWNYSSDKPMLRVKFSIPESWEDNLLESGENIVADELKKEFKSGLNECFVDMWHQEDDGFDDDFYQECLSYIQYLVRVRKGEHWTKANRDAAIQKLRGDYAKIDTFIESRTSYDEV